MFKYCKNCQQNQTRDAFYSYTRNKKVYFQSKCKKCKNSTSSKYTKKHYRAKNGYRIVLTPELLLSFKNSYFYLYNSDKIKLPEI